MRDDAAQHARAKALLATDQIRPPQADVLRVALHGDAQGLDVAGALHLALCAEATDSAFTTFDKALACWAATLGKVPKVLPA